MPQLLGGPRLPFEITIAYMFMQVEKAHLNTIYYRLIQRYRVHRGLARRVADYPRLNSGSTRSNRALIKTMMNTVLGTHISNNTWRLFDNAYKNVRNKILHGTAVGNLEMRECIKDVIDYASQLNIEVNSIAGFEPFGLDLRGSKWKGSNYLQSMRVLATLGFRT